MQIIESQLKDIEPLRDLYLASLPFFQDYYLEFQIPDSLYFKLIENDITIGYVIISSDKVLIEFYLLELYAVQGTDYFIQVLNSSIIAPLVNEVHCKTFDGLLLSACMTNGFEYSIAGWLYRDFFEVNVPLDPSITVRYATLADLPFLNEQDDEVFEPKNMLETAIICQNILIFSKDNSIVGCGFITLIHPKWNYYDIGVWVNTEYRNRGFGTQIITYLKNLCLKSDRIPICGCSFDNYASQQTLGKAGFYSKYRLIEFYINSIAFSQN